MPALLSLASPAHHPFRFLVGLPIFLFGLVVGGAIIGALGRLAVPGRQPIGCLGTTVAGIAGSILGGLIGRAVWGPGHGSNLLLAVLGAALVVWIMSRGPMRSRV